MIVKGIIFVLVTMNRESYEDFLDDQVLSTMTTAYVITQEKLGGNDNDDEYSIIIFILQLKHSLLELRGWMLEMIGFNTAILQRGKKWTRKFKSFAQNLRANQ